MNFTRTNIDPLPGNDQRWGNYLQTGGTLYGQEWGRGGGITLKEAVQTISDNGGQVITLSDGTVVNIYPSPTDNAEFWNFTAGWVGCTVAQLQAPSFVASMRGIQPFLMVMDALITKPFQAATQFYNPWLCPSGLLLAHRAWIGWLDRPDIEALMPYFIATDVDWTTGLPMNQSDPRSITSQLLFQPDQTGRYYQPGTHSNLWYAVSQVSIQLLLELHYGIGDPRSEGAIRAACEIWPFAARNVCMIVGPDNTPGMQAFLDALLGAGRANLVNPQYPITDPLNFGRGGTLYDRRLASANAIWSDDTPLSDNAFVYWCQSASPLSGIEHQIVQYVLNILGRADFGVIFQVI